MLSADSFIDLNCVVVLAVTAVATLTDLHRRLIYRRLTIPVFLTGLFYTMLPYAKYLYSSQELDRQGLLLWAGSLWAWLGPSVLVFLYALFLFWLGIFDGGDGQFLIAITPWCGGYRMCDIITLFYPSAFVFLFIYLLCRYRCNIKELLRDQMRDTRALLACLPQIVRNIRSGEPAVLLRAVPSSSCITGKPPGMVPLAAAVLLSYIL